MVLVMNQELTKTKTILHNSAFTLIELLIVITIISVLAVLGTYGYTYALKISRDTKRQADLGVIQSAIQQYHNDQHFYPGIGPDIPLDGIQFTDATGRSGVPLVTKVYLNKVPSDPIETSPGYLYIGYRSWDDTGSACNSSSNPCQYYCLYAKMELEPSNTSCPDETGFNFELPPP